MEAILHNKKYLKKIILFFTYSIFLSALSFADTHIAGGSVSGTWETDNSPYVINGEIDIPIDSTLIIEPGVSIIFSGHYKFNVHGRLLAIGTVNDTIAFTINDTTGFSNPDTTAGGWHGLRFIDTEVNEQDSSKIIYCELEYGKAVEGDRTGGAIDCFQSSNILIQNCLIRRNFADSDGAGIYCYYSSPTIYNTTVSSNISSYNGGGIYLSKSHTSLQHITLANNYSRNRGGGMFCDESDIEMTDILLTGNHAGNEGGGIYLYESFAVLENAAISKNYATGNGGGLFCDNSSPSLYRAEICQNIATCGGGVYCYNTSSPFLDNVTISDNYADHGGGINCRFDSCPILKNSIMWDNQVEELYLVYGSTITITYSDIMGGWTGEGNIDEDPLFEDSPNGDFHLTASSPCIDAGNPASIPDPDGTIADMGAYYFHQNDVIPPEADFCADITEGNAPLTVHFSDTSYPGNSTIVSWRWDFGDSTFSEEQNPVHIYDSLGIYTVSLQVITENNGINTERKVDYINAFGQGLHISGGNISGIWVTNFSPYIIDGNIQVQPGDSLRIQPGVQVLFSGHYQCGIYGILLAEGTAEDSILFSAQDTITGWNGLIFDNTNSGRQDSSKIVHCTFEHGNVDDYGGAISFINSSNVLIKNTVLTKNSADVYGGGMYCEDSNPNLSGVTICNNISHLGGGGIYFDNSYPLFDPVNRCNIFLNYAGIGNDLHVNNCSGIDILVDTFTVAIPDDHFAYPGESFNFDILNGKVVPVEHDLYVNPYGSNNNSGLTSADPLKTLSYALAKIAPNIDDPYTIHCANGTYSSSMNGEAFPLNCKGYVSISGEDENLTIFDGEEKYNIICCRYDTVVTLENMTVKNGNSSGGSGVHCYSSILDLANMTITENGIISDKDKIVYDKEIKRGIGNKFMPSYLEPDGIQNENGFMPVCDQDNDCLPFQESPDKQSKTYMAGGIYCGGSTLSITDATLSYNNANGYGGALYCEHSSTTLSNVEIVGNSGEFGPGISSLRSNLNLYDTVIRDNRVNYGIGSGAGGGLCCCYSTIYLINTTIEQNYAGNGGGIYSVQDPLLSVTNTTITNNSAAYGGAIHCNETNIELCNTDMHENYADNGGAMYIYGCCPTLSNVSIYNNHGKYCGGIACDNGTVLFNDENLCTIFLNYGGKVNDLYFNSNCPVTDVIVDTFTVVKPNSYFAYPLESFTFDINSGKIQPVKHDLYVNPTGSDNNSGLTPSEPLKTISYALAKIYATKSTPRTIHCAEGLYSSSENGEKFPINCKSYVSIIGEGEDVTILDGEDALALVFCLSDSSVVVTDMTIMNGNSIFGGGIYCTNSTMDIERVLFMNNYADALGGGVLCWNSNVNIHDVTCDGNICQYGRGGGIACDEYSNVSVINGLICNNTSKYGGGLSCNEDSRMLCKNLTIENNTATGEGGGMYCCDDSWLICSGLTIANNISASGAGGIDCGARSTSELTDVVISGNVGHGGGGIECINDSHIDLKNVLIHRNRAHQHCNGIYCAFASMNLVNVTISKNNSTNTDVGGIYLRQADANVVNCILWNDWHDILLQDTLSNATVIYSDIQEGWTGEGNIDADPLFINPSEGNFQLSSGSPSIDAGNPDTTGLHIPNLDLNGNPRIYDDIIDMGCYEWQGADVGQEPTQSLPVLTCSPNPFSTSISISLTKTREFTKNTEIKIYNIKGQLVRKLLLCPSTSSPFLEVTWDGKDEYGKDVKSGVYFYKVSSKDLSVGKMVKIR